MPARETSYPIVGVCPCLAAGSMHEARGGRRRRPSRGIRQLPQHKNRFFDFFNPVIDIDIAKSLGSALGESPCGRKDKLNVAVFED
jgi:hypothetical protein